MIKMAGPIKFVRRITLEEKLITPFRPQDGNTTVNFAAVAIATSRIPVLGNRWWDKVVVFDDVGIFPTLRISPVAVYDNGGSRRVVDLQKPSNPYHLGVVVADLAGKTTGLLVYNWRTGEKVAETQWFDDKNLGRAQPVNGGWGPDYSSSAP